MSRPQNTKIELDAMVQWSLPGEIWSKCSNEYYYVSNLGRVARIRAARGWRHKPSFPRLRSPGGYCFIDNNTRPDGQPRILRVHREIAMAFVPGFRPGLTVNHKDGDKSNNAASNLEWATHSENNQHAYNTGLRQRKLTDEQFIAIRHLRMIPTGQLS